MMLGIDMIWRNEMAQSIEGRKVAILATHGFEQTELTEPQKALKNAAPLSMSCRLNKARFEASST